MQTVANNKTTKTGTIIRFPLDGTLSQSDDRHHHKTLADIWQDNTGEGRIIRLHIRGTSACLILFTIFLLSYFTPDTRLWGDMQLVVSVLVLVVWIGSDIWDSIKISMRIKNA
ncbi:hypothetical protein A4R89_14800 (plasmid) [Acetobacter ascendens]|nr:hypothetical protein A4R89_14800 [Acetobacter ascendens]